MMCFEKITPVAFVLQEKLANKLKKEADEKKFKFAKVDGRTEQVKILRPQRYLAAHRAMLMTCAS